MSIVSNWLDETSIRKIVDEKGCFTLTEYESDPSINPQEAIQAYYQSAMYVRRRQVTAKLDNSGVIIQSGAMQMMLGKVNAATNVKGAGDLFKKAIGGKVTGEATIKPKYTGSGYLILEPTYKHIFFEDISEWNGGMVIEDGLFLACEDTINYSVIARSTLSSAALGGEGLFNVCLAGNGIAALESPVPKEELVSIELNNDTLKVDGNMAIAWSKGLDFTVERTTKTLIGSTASGEGLVNVYRGTGRVLVAPIR